MSVKPSLSPRVLAALKIIASPYLYKVCEGCESIVAVRVTSCPNCHGYRFSEDTEGLIEQARKLATREQTSVTAEDLYN
ncbi:MAG: hypothetical protein ACK5NG_03460 [Chthoniobacterales bacterium]